jgi:hypothetical protein
MSIPAASLLCARGALEGNYARVDRPGRHASSNGSSCKASRVLRSVSGDRAPRSSWAQRKTIHQRLDNVIAATSEEIRVRFRQAASDAIGDQRTLKLEELVDNCASLPDSRVIAAWCRLEPAEQRLRPASR